MIPILYNRDETRFITNGIGRLSDCTRFVVTEERNGIYEAEFDYPITGAHFDEIKVGKIVACTHDDKHDIQPFIIYARSIPDLNGIVTFNAHHISYRLCDVVVMPYTAGSVAAALEGIGTNSVNSNPFTFWTDKTTVATFTNDVPRPARNMLGGEENSILDVYGGGDYEFDRFEVKLHASRGQDSDVEIRYSKNMTNLSQTISEENSYNAVVPYWTNGDEIVTLPEQMLVFEGTEPQIAYLTDHNLIIIRTETDEPIEVAYTIADAAPMDLSDAFEEKPTVAQLRAAAIARFERSGAWLPNEKLTVDFVQLWQTEEFRDYAALQRVSLCDTVSVYYPQVGISAVKQKVIKVVYNVLLDRYDSIELGALQTSLGKAIETQIMENVPTTSMMQSAIQYATDLIRGGLGGYVVMTPGANGYPQEILIMDTPDVNTAVNVWRFNQGGLGHSHNGYQGPFNDVALTQDGKINASMITTGAMNADLITAGTLSADRVRGGTLVAGGSRSGIIEIRDANDTVLTRMSRAGITTYNTSKSLTGGYYFGTSIRDDRLGFLRNEERDFSGTASLNPSATVQYYWATFGPDLQFRRVPSLSLSNDEGDTSMGAGEGTTSVSCYSDTLTEYQTQHSCSVKIKGEVVVLGALHVRDTLSTGGAKPRDVKTKNYSNRYLYAYETPTPLFGDIGEAVLDADGICYVDIDDIFSETIELRQEYQVFLQKEGEGDCWVADKQKRYFVIKGTPNLKVAWELKAKQRDYDMIRLEQPDNGLDEYEMVTDKTDKSLDTFITEQEEILYG